SIKGSDPCIIQAWIAFSIDLLSLATTTTSLALLIPVAIFWLFNTCIAYGIDKCRISIQTICCNPVGIWWDLYIRSYGCNKSIPNDNGRCDRSFTRCGNHPGIDECNTARDLR